MYRCISPAKIDRILYYGHIGLLNCFLVEKEIRTRKEFTIFNTFARIQNIFWYEINLTKGFAFHTQDVFQLFAVSTLISTVLLNTHSKLRTTKISLVQFSKLNVNIFLYLNNRNNIS